MAFTSDRTTAHQRFKACHATVRRVRVNEVRAAGTCAVIPRTPCRSTAIWRKFHLGFWTTGGLFGEVVGGLWGAGVRAPRHPVSPKQRQVAQHKLTMRRHRGLGMDEVAPGFSPDARAVVEQCQSDECTFLGRRDSPYPLTVLPAQSDPPSATYSGPGLDGGLVHSIYATFTVQVANPYKLLLVVQLLLAAVSADR